MKAFIHAYAAIFDKGILTPDGLSPWESTQGGPVDLRREQVLPRPYPAFGKLPLAERLAFGAASLIFSKHPDKATENTALCAAAPWGSLTTDLLYIDSIKNGFPSPAHFSATLPSSVLSEIAIFYKLKGPNRVFVGPNGSREWALFSALDLIAGKRTESVLVVIVDSVDPGAYKSSIGITPETPQALLLLITAERPSITPVLSASNSSFRGESAPLPINDFISFFDSNIPSCEITHAPSMRTLLISRDS